MLIVIICVLDTYRVFLNETDSMTTTLSFGYCDDFCLSEEEAEAIEVMHLARDHAAG